MIKVDEQRCCHPRISKFPDDAIDEKVMDLHRRDENRLCDLALLVGFAEERQTIGPAQLEAVSQELVAVAPE